MAKTDDKIAAIHARKGVDPRGGRRYGEGV